MTGFAAWAAVGEGAARAPPAGLHPARPGDYSISIIRFAMVLPLYDTV